MHQPFGRDWWPTDVRRPHLRLILAFLLSPVIVSGVATLLAWLVFATYYTTSDRVMASTMETAMVALGASLVISALFCLPLTLLLWRLRLRSVWHFFLAGILAGLIVAVLTPFVSGAPLTVSVVLAMGVWLMAMFYLIRLIAGIRSVSSVRDLAHPEGRLPPLTGEVIPPSDEDRLAGSREDDRLAPPSEEPLPPPTDQGPPPRQ